MKYTIYPCLWFDGNARQAADFYCSVFENSTVASENPIVVIALLSGQKFMCLNGGPKYKPNASISFFVKCETHEEVEKAYTKLIDGGSALMPLGTYPWSEKYGWVQDKFGVNWQLFFGKNDDTDQKFAPSLMFTGDNAGRAEEAIANYTKIFEHSSIVSLARYEKGEHDVEGTIKHGICRIGDYVVRVMDSSMPHGFGFTEGVSLVVECDTQEQIDYLWEQLTAGGHESQCGWLQDKYGVSWQIVPKILAELMGDPARSQRVVAAFMQMKKFNIQKLIEA